MYVLALDTATPTVSAAIGREGVTLAEIRVAASRQHAEQLTPALESLRAACNIEWSQVAVVACGVGPGLFTGLRVGVTTAKTMAFALNVPTVGISSLDLVAWPLRHAARPVVSLIDARRGEVFWTIHTPVPGGLERRFEPVAARPDDVVAELIAADEPVLLAGDGARAYRDVLVQFEHAEFAGSAFDAPCVRDLVDLAWQRFVREEFTSPFELEPVYGRGADITAPGPKAM